MSEIRVGTCGFCMRHAAYFGTFDILEVQKTFYDPPQRFAVTAGAGSR